MRSRPQRIAIDMDEVIADLNAARARWLAGTFGYVWSQADLTGASLRALAADEHNRAWEEMLHGGAFFDTLEVMPGSQEALAMLAERFEIFIASAAMEFPASCGPKYAWLRRHFPFIPPLNIVFCGDKSVIAADFLVDDSVRHFARFRGQGVLFSAPHNLSIDWPLRVTGWEEASRVLLERARDS